MDSLDNMFVPYKDVLYPPSTTSSKGNFSKTLFWIAGLLVVVALGYLYFSKGKSNFPTLLQENLPLLSKSSIPILPTVTPSLKAPIAAPIAPPLKDIPKTISLIRGGQKEVYSSPTELARNVGTAVKETLLTFPQMNAPLVANVVQCAIKSVLDSQKPNVVQQLPPNNQQVPLNNQPPPNNQPPANVAQQVPQSPVIREGKISLVNLPIPFIDEEEVTNESGKKQGKINAESNPYVIQMMKERGFDKKE